ncbi:ROK family protein [Nocardioides sp. BGMRC 2183]|nr:ROK family protein [Nocardioides sp. BGMRC 2183]
MTTGLLIGLDIGATKILGVAVEPDGRLVAQARTPTPNGGDAVVAAAAGVVDKLRAETGSRPAHAVGVGVPGLVDTARGTLQNAVNLGVNEDWFPLGAALSERIDAAVVVDNDANAAALGVARRTGHDDLAYLSIGTGLAAALVLGGRIRRGLRGAAGEIGHIPIDPAGPRCPCGQVGCLETFASGSAVAAAWPSDQAPPAQALFDAADAGAAAAVLVRDTFAARVADAVRLVALSVDPAAVVLGGGVAHVGERLLVAVRSALTAQAAESPFLTSLDLAGRLSLMPLDTPVAALGAAILGEEGR